MSGMVPTLAKKTWPCASCHELIATQTNARQYGVKIHAGKGLCHNCWRKKAEPKPLPPVEPEQPFRRRQEASWRTRAICVGTDDPEAFFPVSNDMNHPQWDEAKKLCRHCPVKAECVDDALDTGALHGVRGGLDRKQLEELHRRRAQAEKRTA